LRIIAYGGNKPHIIASNIDLESYAQRMPQLKTHITVSALIRRAQSGGAFAAILRKGDKDAGAYLALTRQFKDNADTYILYRPIRNMDGEPVWWPKGPLTQAELDTYINRRIDEDPDIWVVEIEDAQGRHFLVEPIEGEKTAIVSDDDTALQAAIKAAFQDR